MVMGQSMDCNACETADTLTTLQDYKTGALFRAAVGAGAACAHAGSQQRQALTAFANAYGMLFQITDDILDFEGSAEILGKSVGKDAAAGKVTFVTVYGLDGAKVYAQNYAREARGRFEHQPGSVALYGACRFYAYAESIEYFSAPGGGDDALCLQNRRIADRRVQEMKPEPLNVF
jgi:geranylgeranyl pyrophosphate synthase